MNLKQLFRNAALLALLTPIVAVATTIDPAKYGQLKQSDIVNCPNEACGPAAAVNSFVFLQNMYPSVYGAKLVGLDPSNPPLHWQTLAGDILAMDPYMGTCCNAGTSIEKFILGKQKYIEDAAAGSTIYMAQMDRDWDLTKSGGAAKPGYVEDNTVPSVAWLQREIDDGEDVELLITYTDGRVGSHWVTLNEFTSSEMTLNFIDPLTGMPLKEGAVYDLISQGFRKYIHISYFDPLNPNNQVDAVITGAVSESPVPEPGTAALFLLAIPVLYWMRTSRSGKTLSLKEADRTHPDS